MSVYDNGPVRFYGVSHVTATLSSKHPEVGTKARVGDESYVWVYNTGSSTVGVSKCATISGVTGYSVTVSTTTSVDFIVGVCKHTDIPTGSYGWLLTEGFAAVEMEEDNSCAAGQLLTVAADGEFALKSNATATGYQSPAFGKSMEAIASGASGQAFIRLSGI